MADFKTLAFECPAMVGTEGETIGTSGDLHEEERSTHADRA